MLVKIAAVPTEGAATLILMLIPNIRFSSSFNFCLTLSGQQVYEALENGVSQYPKLEGRFPQVAGIHFGFDPDCPPGERILIDQVKIQGEKLDPQRVSK